MSQNTERQEAFEAKWGELSAYNGDSSKGIDNHPPEKVARMLRQQAAYDRLLATGRDLVSEKPRPDATEYTDTQGMLDECERMENEAAEIEATLPK